MDKFVYLLSRHTTDNIGNETAIKFRAHCKIKMFNKVLKETNLFFCKAGTLGDDVMRSCTKHRNGTGGNVSFILQSVY